MIPGEKKAKITNKLNNGLTPGHIEKAREILAKVNVEEICRKLDVRRATLENVLRGTGKEVNVLKRALAEAKKQIKQKEKTIKALPL